MSDNIAYAAAELASTLRDESTERVRGWAGLIDDPDTLAILNRADAVLEEPVEETPLGREIIRAAATETIDHAAKTANVSQMKSATGLTNQNESKEEFFTQVASRLTHEGAVGLVFGSPGAGKTSVVLDTATVWRAITGGRVVANIDWDGADAQFYSDDEMLETMAGYQGPVLAVLDEIAQELSGFGTGSKKAEAFSDSLLFIRKRQEEHGEYAKRGSVLSVAHTRTKTAKEIRRVASFAVEKPDRTRPDRARVLESEGGKDEWEEQACYQGITDTVETYDEYQASEFTVSEEYDSENGTGGGGKQDDIETALRLYYGEADLTGREAADAVGKSDTWFYNQKTAFESGDLAVGFDLDENGGVRSD